MPALKDRYKLNSLITRVLRDSRAFSRRVLCKSGNKNKTHLLRVNRVSKIYLRVLGRLFHILSEYKKFLFILAIYLLVKKYSIKVFTLIKHARF